jgi:hypothetical protein
MVGSRSWWWRSEAAERDGGNGGGSGGEADWRRGIEHQTLGLELYARWAAAWRGGWECDQTRWRRVWSRLVPAPSNPMHHAAGNPCRNAAVPAAERQSMRPGRCRGAADERRLYRGFVFV